MKYDFIKPAVIIYSSRGRAMKVKELLRGNLVSLVAVEFDHSAGNRATAIWPKSWCYRSIQMELEFNHEQQRSVQPTTNN